MAWSETCAIDEGMRFVIGRGLSALGRPAHDPPEPFARQPLLRRDVLVARVLLQAGEDALEAQRAGGGRERRADGTEWSQSGHWAPF